MRLLLIATLISAAFAVSASLMMPLDTIVNGHVNTDYNFEDKFYEVKEMGFDGIMMDVWWGITEVSDRYYSFSNYIHIIDAAARAGLKVQLVASFHRCGGNIGDPIYIPIPEFVRSAGDRYFFKDMDGKVNDEYIAGFADHEPFIGRDNRTPIEAYTDWFKALRAALGNRLGSIVTEIQVGLGPAGELRYPSYRVSTFPNLGEFQCYSDLAIESYQKAMQAAGHPEWTQPPRDVCRNGYDCQPEQSQFFRDGVNSDYGTHFIKWYSGELVEHGRRVLSVASEVFPTIAAKVAGIHWLYTAGHEAELTAGYPNGGNRPGYYELAKMFKQVGAAFDFTCLEKEDDTEPSNARAAPGSLVRQVLATAADLGVEFSGENALPCSDMTSFNRILAKYRDAPADLDLGAYTHLRWSDEVFNNKNNFKSFINSLHAM